MLDPLVPLAAVRTGFLFAWQMLASIPASPLWPSENSILASLTAENFSSRHQTGARPTSSVHDELQQGFTVGGMGFQGSVSPAPALVQHMSMHYHSPLATFWGLVHDGNDH